MSYPFKPSRCIKASFYNPENRFNFPTTDCFRKKISMKLFYQYMTILFNFSPTLHHLHPLEVENCDSNSRLVVDEDDNGKFRPERVNPLKRCNKKITFHALEVLSRYRDPQLQVGENYLFLFNL